MYDFDQFSPRNPQVSLGSYIDDDTVVAHGDEDEIVANLTKAGHDLKVIFSERLNVHLAEDK
eukprot:4970334-Pyramimonas_sp.AAC.1